MKPIRLVVVIALLVVFASILPAQAQASSGALLYAVTDGGNLISFNSAAPGTTLSSVPLTGISGSVVGIDFRPANGQLIAISSESVLYRVDTSTGAATALGGTLSTPLNGSIFGFDFNPTVDRLRLTSDAQQNLRLNPINGGVAAVDGTLAYNSSDVNAGAAPFIVASAYTNSAAGATTTTLYNIDANLDVLVTQVPPNDGGLNTVGALGVDATAGTAFDILGTSYGYMTIGSSFYTVNLGTGAATPVGSVGDSVVALSAAVGFLPAGSAVVCGAVGALPNSIATIGVPENTVTGGDVFCRVLVQNAAFVQPQPFVGNQALISAGILQAVDVFGLTADGGPVSSFNNGVNVCLLGQGRFVFLDGSQSLREATDLSASYDGLYTCATLPTYGTALLVRG